MKIIQTLTHNTTDLSLTCGGGFCVNSLDVTPTESLGPSALCGSHPHHFLFDKLLPLIGGIIHRHSSYASSVHSVDILLTLIKTHLVMKFGDKIF